jgi:hypothetical protein
MDLGNSPSRIDTMTVRCAVDWGCPFLLDLIVFLVKGDNHMLIQYIEKAMSKAVYDKLENGSFSRKIPNCPGVVVFGKILFQCQRELRSSLEGWLIVKIRHGDKLPVIDRINLNKMMPTIQEVAVHG